VQFHVCVVDGVFEVVAGDAEADADAEQLQLDHQEPAVRDRRLPFTLHSSRSARGGERQQSVASGRSPHQIRRQKADSQVKRLANRMRRRGVEGQFSTFVAGCMQAWRKVGGRGAFSGPRSRGTGFGSRASRHQHRLFLRWSQPPRMGLRPSPEPPARACGRHAKAWHATPNAPGRWWCTRAQAPIAVAPHGCRAQRCRSGCALRAITLARERGRARARTGH